MIDTKKLLEDLNGYEEDLIRLHSADTYYIQRSTIWRGDESEVRFRRFCDDIRLMLRKIDKVDKMIEILNVLIEEEKRHCRIKEK